MPPGLQPLGHTPADARPGAEAPEAPPSASDPRVLRGIVLAPDLSTAAVGTLVQCLGRGRGTVAETTTGPDGAFELELPTAGDEAAETATFVLLAVGHDRLSISYPREVRVPSGTPAVLRLRAAGTLVVTALTPEGRPAADAQLLMQSRPMHPRLHQWETGDGLMPWVLHRTDGQGHAALPVIPGRLRVWARAAGGPLGAPESVRVEPGERAEVVVRIGSPPTTPLQIAVIDERGEPVPGASVRFSTSHVVAADPRTVDATEHLRTDRVGMVATVPLGPESAYPLALAVGAREYRIERVELNAPPQGIVQVVLRLRPHFVVQVSTATVPAGHLDLPLEIDVRPVEVEPRVERYHASLKDHLGYAFHAIWGSATVMPAHAPGAHRVFVDGPGTYEVQVRVPGGLRVQGTIRVDAAGDGKTLQIQLPQGRVVHVRRQPVPATVHPLTAATSITWESPGAEGDAGPLESRLSAARDDMDIWVPAGFTVAHVKAGLDFVGAWALPPVPVGEQDGTELAFSVPLPQQARTILQVVRDQRAVAIEGIPILLMRESPAGTQLARRLVTLESGVDGRVAIHLDAGTYHATVSETVGPAHWIRFDVTSQGGEEVHVPLTAPR